MLRFSIFDQIYTSHFDFVCLFSASIASFIDYASGFGGKFGVQRDRQDKSAVGWEHIEKSEKHESQKDYKTGFGGQFGVQNDRQDKSAVGWEHQEKLTKHESQKGMSGKGSLKIKHHILGKQEEIPTMLRSFQFGF